MAFFGNFLQQVGEECKTFTENATNTFVAAVHEPGQFLEDTSKAISEAVSDVSANVQSAVVSPQFAFGNPHASPSAYDSPAESPRPRMNRRSSEPDALRYMNAPAQQMQYDQQQGGGDQQQQRGTRQNFPRRSSLGAFDLRLKEQFEQMKLHGLHSSGENSPNTPARLASQEEASPSPNNRQAIYQQQTEFQPSPKIGGAYQHRAQSTLSPLQIDNGAALRAAAGVLTEEEYLQRHSPYGTSPQSPWLTPQQRSPGPYYPGNGSPIMNFNLGPPGNTIEFEPIRDSPTSDPTHTRLGRQGSMNDSPRGDFQAKRRASLEDLAAAAVANRRGSGSGTGLMASPRGGGGEDWVVVGGGGERRGSGSGTPLGLGSPRDQGRRGSGSGSLLSPKGLDFPVVGQPSPWDAPAQRASPVQQAPARRNVLVTIPSLDPNSTLAAWWALQHILRSGDGIVFLYTPPDWYVSGEALSGGRDPTTAAAQLQLQAEQNVSSLLSQVVTRCQTKAYVKVRVVSTDNPGQSIRRYVEHVGNVALLVFGSGVERERDGSLETISYLRRHLKCTIASVPNKRLPCYQPTDRRAIAVAVHKSSLHLIYSWLVKNFLRDGDYLMFFKVGKDITDVAIKKLQGSVQRVLSNQLVKSAKLSGYKCWVLSKGNTAQALLDAATEAGAQMIILGNRPYDQIHSALSKLPGRKSTKDECFKHAQIPVLTVSGQDE